MEPQTNSWNDDRLDELSRRTEKGFDEVKGEVKELRQETLAGFIRVDERFDRLNHRLLIVSVGIIAAIIGTGILG